jgi:hypothetical protein
MGYKQPKPSDYGLVCDFPLDGGFTSGVTFWDTTNSYTGTATNSPTPQYPGFDFVAASSMYIDVGACYNGVKTISLWINQDDVAGNEYPIDLNGTDYLSIESGVVTVNGLAGHTLYVDGAAGTSGVTTVTANWHHIAITDTSTNNASDFDIGRADIGPAVYYDGLIGDVRLYSRVLTATEIRSIYYLQRHRYQT